METWVEKYLHRIGLEIEDPSLDYLNRLQLAHILSVPFENTAIMAKPTRDTKSLSLEVDDLIKKIVSQRRGGFCFELNGIFGQLLWILGFKTTYLAALMIDDSNYLPDPGIIDHMVLAVDLPEGRYYTDVGAGTSNRQPLMLGQETSDVSGTYRIVRLQESRDAVGLDTSYTLALERKKPEWGPVYIFSEKVFQLSDYHQSCYWMETTTKSHFTQRLVVSRTTESGRITISGNTLKITDDSESYSNLITHDQLATILEEHFRILSVPTYFGRTIEWKPI